MVAVCHLRTVSHSNKLINSKIRFVTKFWRCKTAILNEIAPCRSVIPTLVGSHDRAVDQLCRGTAQPIDTLDGGVYRQGFQDRDIAVLGIRPAAPRYGCRIRRGDVYRRTTPEQRKRCLHLAAATVAPGEVDMVDDVSAVDVGQVWLNWSAKQRRQSGKVSPGRIRSFSGFQLLFECP